VNAGSTSRATTTAGGRAGRPRHPHRHLHGEGAGQAAIETTPEAIVAAGVNWWPLQFARELDDAILNLRTNELEIGTWVLKTRGDANLVMRPTPCWSSRRTTGWCARPSARCAARWPAWT
jgi:hypothetical protein